MSCSDGDAEQEQAGESQSRGAGSLFDAPMYCSPCRCFPSAFFVWLAPRFVGQMLFIMVCVKRAWLKVSSVSWNCSEGSPSSSSPLPDVVLGFPAGKICNLRYALLREYVPLTSKERCKNERGEVVGVFALRANTFWYHCVLSFFFARIRTAKD